MQLRENFLYLQSPSYSTKSLQIHYMMNDKIKVYAFHTLLGVFYTSRQKYGYEDSGLGFVYPCFKWQDLKGDIHLGKFNVATKHIIFTQFLEESEPSL